MSLTKGTGQKEEEAVSKESSTSSDLVHRDKLKLTHT